LQKKKEELRAQQIAQQKQMLEILTKKLKAGNLSKEEKEDLIKTMKQSTDTLQELLQKESMALLQKKEQQQKEQLPQTATSKPQIIKETMLKKEKDRLDRELESISRTSALSSSSSSLSSPTGDASASPTPTPASSSPPSSISSALSSPPPSISSPPLKTGDASSTLQHLQSLKQNLEQQAISMGLDPSALHKIPTMGGRGRGRGGGRGAIAARGRGRGGGLSLDNRPTSLFVSGLPSDTNEAALRAHFLPFGELSSVEFPSPAQAVIQFADRFRAEAALAGGKLYKGHKLQITWHNAAAKVPAAQENKPSTTDSEKEKSEESHESLLSSSTASMDPDSSEPYGHFDEDEEDTERSWKH
jgi:hypothetical protein